MRALPALACALTGVALAAACTQAPPTPPATQPSVTSAAPGTSAPPTASPSLTEPTTTNTLPPPPSASAAAPKKAGRLGAQSLPVPRGWRTTVLPGGDEQGYEGNGTWVHARDPRYAAQDLVSIGCADVTRDDYTDPKAALYGDYSSRDGEPGVGLALDFGDAAAAERFWRLYVRQVRACTAPGADPRITGITEPTAADGGQGLIDRRDGPDQDWTEVAERNGTRLTLLILGDPDHRISRAAADAILAQISSS